MEVKKFTPTQEQINLKREIDTLEKSYGYRYLDLELHNHADRLLSALCDACDNPDVEANERLQLVYQIACNLKAVMDFFGAIQTIKDNGTKSDTEVK